MGLGTKNMIIIAVLAVLVLGGIFVGVCYKKKWLFFKEKENTGKPPGKKD